MPRIHCPAPLATGQLLALPAGAARHVQVLRMQPGDDLTLFNGEGGEWQARIERMGRADVQVLVQEHCAVEREAARAVHLAVGASYPESGGVNESAVHTDMVCDLRRGGRLEVDGEVLQEDGAFVV